MNIARVAALRLGCGKHVPAWTVQRNCGSGMQAIDSGAQAIASGRAELILAGGTEAMSHVITSYSIHYTKLYESSSRERILRIPSVAARNNFV